MWQTWLACMTLKPSQSLETFSVFFSFFCLLTAGDITCTSTELIIQFIIAVKQFCDLLLCYKLLRTTVSITVSLWGKMTIKMSSCPSTGARWRAYNILIFWILSKFCKCNCIWMHALLCGLVQYCNSTQWYTFSIWWELLTAISDNVRHLAPGSPTSILWRHTTYNLSSRPASLFIGRHTIRIQWIYVREYYVLYDMRERDRESIVCSEA